MHDHPVLSFSQNNTLSQLRKSNRILMLPIHGSRSFMSSVCLRQMAQRVAFISSVGMSMAAITTVGSSVSSWGCLVCENLLVVKPAEIPCTDGVSGAWQPALWVLSMNLQRPAKDLAFHRVLRKASAG